jgi:hypothetical protein
MTGAPHPSLMFRCTPLLFDRRSFRATDVSRRKLTFQRNLIGAPARGRMRVHGATGGPRWVGSTGAVHRASAEGERTPLVGERAEAA